MTFNAKSTHLTLKVKSTEPRRAKQFHHVKAYMYALMASGALNTQGFMSEFLCAIYKVSVIQVLFTLLGTRHFCYFKRIGENEVE